MSQTGAQRYQCTSCQRTFQLEYRQNASKPGVKEQIIAMTMNGSGIRDIGRVLNISTDTVIATIKAQQANIVNVNQGLLKQSQRPETGIDVEIISEMDEPWSFVQKKASTMVVACH